jgi:Mg-chelatase subunit ChlD
MALRFTDPLVLLALPFAVALVLLLARRRGRSDPHVRRAGLVRTLAVAALVLALAGPRWDAAGRGLDLVVLVDASDSTGAARADVDRTLTAIVDAKPTGDRMAVAAVGRDAQVEHALRVDPPRSGLSVRVDGTQTDLARGLRLARGLAGSEQRRRVVLVTDGQATRGDTAAAIRELTGSGVAVDVLPVDAGFGADVLIAGVSAPGVARLGERYEVAVDLRNTGAIEAGAELVVTADGEEVHREAVRLPPGATTVRIPRTADADGSTRYVARLSSGASTELRNDLGAAAVQVAGAASVLLVEGASGEGEALAGALEAGGFAVVRRGASEGFPGLDELLGHDAAVMVDVDHELVGSAGEVALDAYVRDAGRGLTVVGGERSYGLGGYDGTRLEELLPVFASVEDPQRRPSVAQALVVDVSGSMAACHCRPDGFAGGVREIEGPNKTAITKRAVVRAIENMDARDTVGVLAFHTDPEWVLPLQGVPTASIAEGAVANLTPEGDTAISVGVEEAIAGLRDVEARLRHIVLFTDGLTSESGLEQVAEAAAAEGITLSVVGTGEMPTGSSDVLQKMATAGNGRYYPGRDLASIPGVLASEVMMVARPLVEEGRFIPIVTASDPITDGLDESPPLFGYIATTPKPTARTLLRIGDERDPLLASWQAGLGTVSAWSSDTTSRWASPWVGWDGSREVWSSIVRATLPVEATGGVDVRAAFSADGLDIELTGDEPLPEGVSVIATVVDPDGRRTEVPLIRTGLDRFAAAASGDLDGIHGVTVSATRDGVEIARRTVTAIRAYPAEYTITESGTRAAAALVPAGGRFDPTAAELFRREGTEPGRTPRDLTALLLVLALVLLPLDVGLRRLRPERGDLRRVLGGGSPHAAEAGAGAGAGTDPLEAPTAPSSSPPRPGSAGDGAQTPEPSPPPAPPASSAASLLDARRRARGAPTDDR